MTDIDHGETMRLLARMLEEKDRFWSAPSLHSTTMKLRKMTEDGFVQMSLSKPGLPFYQITNKGEQAVVADW